MPCRHQCMIAVDGSLRSVAGKYAACGWAVVQFDVVGSHTPWHGMYGTIPVYIEVQRTIKRSNIWASYMAVVRQSGRRAFSLITLVSCKRSSQEKMAVSVMSIMTPTGGA